MIGAGIEQDEIIRLGGNDCGNGRTIHAVKTAAIECGRGHDAAGIAGRNDGVRLAVIDQFNGATIEQSFFLRRPSSGLSSIVSTSLAWTILTRGSLQFGPCRAALISASLPTRYSSADLRSACNASLTPSMTTPQPWSPPMTSTAIRINEKSAETRTIPRS